MNTTTNDLAALSTDTLRAEIRELEPAAGWDPDYYVRLMAQCQLDARCRELARRGVDC